MSRYDDVKAALRKDPRCFLVTGAAGFIGGHIVETLLSLNQRVIGVDNFSTGSRDTIAAVGQGNPLFTFHEGDIQDAAFMDTVCVGVDIVLHQAALGSVPRSINDPKASHKSNVDGFVQVLLSAKKASVKRVVYASSSSVYGDEPALPKREEKIGQPLSPYAATKRINEIYADVFARTYGMSCVGLRYFNVFGPRQDPNGPYAAVIPIWVSRLLRGEACVINGDGETSRDFCYVANAVQANLLAAVVDEANGVFNVACGARTTLNELYASICARTGKTAAAHYVSERAGDVHHSLADISRARDVLGYEPTHNIGQGLDVAVASYIAAGL